MNTSTLQSANMDNEHIEAQCALHYLRAIVDLSKKIPEKNSTLYKSADYKDRKWLRQLFDLGCEHQSLLHKIMLKCVYAVIFCSSKFLSRLCLVDDVIAIITDEEPFCRSRASYNETLIQTQDLRRQAYAKCTEEALSEIIPELDQYEANMKHFLDFFLKACDESRQLKRQYLQLFSVDGEVTDEMLTEYCYDAIDKEGKSDLDIAVSLRDLIPYEYRRRHTGDYDDIDQTMVRLRRESLEMYGFESVFGAIGQILRGEAESA